MPTARPIHFAFLPALLLAGCGGGHPLMPLAVGRSTTYVVKFGFDSRVEPVKVTRRIAVAGVDGYELAGPLGVSRLAWNKGTLYSDQAVNASFEPSLPMLAEDAKDRVWHGRVVSMGKVNPATARLVHKKSSVVIGGRKLDTTLAVLTLTIPGGEIELDSWYAPEIGLVQQEQRTNNVRVVQLQMVTAP